MEEKYERIDKVNYYLDIAETVAERSTCIRKRYGTVLVKNDEIISTGYSGAPRNRDNCIDLGYCSREKTYPGIERGLGYDACRSVHSEQNAIISASRKDMIGSTLYLVGVRGKEVEYEQNASPCQMCRKMIINAGIEKVIIRDTKSEYREIDVEEWIYNDDMKKGKLGY